METTIVDSNLLPSDQTGATAPRNLADYIYPAIQKEYVSILTNEADVLSEDGEEAIHQMRVSLRRLRSQVCTFETILDLPKVMGDKQIGKIARVLGKVRDLDVLHKNFKHYRADMPKSERDCLEEVGSAINKRRHKELLKVKVMLDDRDYQFFKLGINNWLNNPQYTPVANIECSEILPDLLLPVASRVFIDPSWWLDLDLDRGNSPEAAMAHLLLVRGDMLHNLRKQVKALRYSMEIFVDRYPSQYRDYLKEFKQIHQIFGHIQDNVVLDKFIRKVLGKHAPAKVPTFYDRIAHNNYQQWQDWQPIRDRYRQATIKREFELFLLSKS